LLRRRNITQESIIFLSLCLEISRYTGLHPYLQTTTQRVAMARGNWERRAETAEKRKKEAKDRKHKNEDKRLYKQWVQDVLRILDQHAERLGGSAIAQQIHIWTETLAMDSPPLLDVYEDETTKSSRRKQRANSIEIADTGRKGRGRSNSVTENTKKKPHPRSHEPLEDADTGAAKDIQLLLCRSHFFTGKCEEASRKKGACRCIHYSSHHKTLNQIINSKKHTPNQHELLVAEAAAEAAVEDEGLEPGAVEMVYYLSVNVNVVTGRKEGEKEANSVSEQIVSSLAEKKVKFSSIVYMAMGDLLIFDRYRDGALMSNDGIFFTVLASDASTGQRKISISGEGDIKKGRFHLLPGTVLEHMLRFLPDASVAAASQVCKPWYYEIGQNSPDLWRHLLERRNWPLPSETTVGSDEANGMQRFRDTFLRHYSVFRDAISIQYGLSALDATKKPAITREMVYQDFSTRKHAPSEPNTCVSVHAWEPNQILAAYEYDCSLRLFQTAAKSDSNEMTCKELVCQRVDPYLKTKKRKCRMLSMALDEDCIGCICLVSTDSVAAVAYVLVVVNRDDFLLGESSDVAENPGVSEAHLNVIDIGEAILNYIFSSEGADYSVQELLHELVEYLQEGGEVGNVEVLVSPNFAACGYGRFMLEVAISIPSLEAGDDELRLLGRKLVLFSAGVGAIVWTGESTSLNNGPLPRTESVVLSSIRRPQTTGSRAACSIAISPHQSPGPIVLLDIEHSGEVSQIEFMECPPVSMMQLREEGWTPAHPFRATQITPSHVVVADTFAYQREDDVPVSCHKVIVSFLPRFSCGDDSSCSTLCLNDMQTLQMACVRDDYIFLLCVGHPSPAQADPFAELDGQWFGPDRETDDSRRSLEQWAVVVHIASCREIGRRRWLPSSAHLHLLDDFPRLVMMADAHDTIGVGLSWRGVVMTGSDVRGVGASSHVHMIQDAPLRSSKKKKKGGKARGSKKDGFARGQSLWG
jgi:hypothetical protein